MFTKPLTFYVVVAGGTRNDDSSAHPKDSFGVSYYNGVDGYGDYTGHDTPKVALAYFDTLKARNDFLRAFENHPAMPAELKKEI